MKIREKIYESIRGMDARELSILYEQIKSIKAVGSKPMKEREIPPLEQIHELTSSSGNWADFIEDEREERL